jgi:hypothetical protein
LRIRGFAKKKGKRNQQKNAARCAQYFHGWAQPNTATESESTSSWQNINLHQSDPVEPFLPNTVAE